MCIYLFTYLIH